MPALIKQADSAFENPMIDRDPVPTWRDGPVALLGDAAHAMYPTGSNGGSQAIIDARVLGAAMVEHGVTPEALAAYDEKLCGPISQLILRNRGAGPFGLLNMVDERCGGTFDNIDDVIPAAERTAFMAGYMPPRALPLKHSTRRRRRSRTVRACAAHKPPQYFHRRKPEWRHYLSPTGYFGAFRRLNTATTDVYRGCGRPAQGRRRDCQAGDRRR